MFIKTLRHKYNSIGDLLFYMVRGMDDPEKDMMLSHNLPSFDIEEMKKEFLINDLYRQQTRAEVRWYHELLSFSPHDKEHLDTPTLQAITQEYIQRRNPNAMCFAVAHTSEAHTHIHLCFSGTEYRSKTVLRMDDRTFKNLREGTERWQVEQFPELKNSIVYIDREQTKERAKSRDKNTRKENEYQAKRRLKKRPTEKQYLQDELQEAFNTSETIEQFYAAIRESNITIYERNGKPVGITGKRKYRFGTLGITKDMLQSLDRLAKRQREAQMLAGRNEEYERER